jgi:hydrogenase maturation protease
MTATRPSRPQPGRPSAASRPAVAVEVVVCGSVDRADDGAPTAACRFLRPLLPPDVRLRIVGQLDIDDLLSIASGAGVVVVDTATGLTPGAVVELPLTGPSSGTAAVRPRSCHALAIPEVVGLAEMIRGRPIVGRIVAIGGAQFGLGRPLSRVVEAALPALAQATVEALAHVRVADDAGGPS